MREPHIPFATNSGSGVAGAGGAASQSPVPGIQSTIHKNLSPSSSSSPSSSAAAAAAMMMMMMKDENINNQTGRSPFGEQHNNDPRVVADYYERSKNYLSPLNGGVGVGVGGGIGGYGERNDGTSYSGKRGDLIGGLFFTFFTIL